MKIFTILSLFYQRLGKLNYYFNRTLMNLLHERFNKIAMHAPVFGKFGMKCCH